MVHIVATGRSLTHIALLVSCIAIATASAEDPQPATPSSTRASTGIAPGAPTVLAQAEGGDSDVAPDLPKAENIDLSDPVAEELPEAVPVTTPPTEEAAAASDGPVDDPVEVAAEQDTATVPQDDVAAVAQPEPMPEEPFVILNTVVERGTTTRLPWSPDLSFEGIATPTPVLIAHGAKAGPSLCLTAAVHGDELNGIEIIRSVMYDIDPAELAGTVIAVPIVNLQGFRRSSRYLTDRRDLNRFFPGNAEGSSASRIAHSFFQQVIMHCDMLVDLHTGSFYRTNLPQLRADLNRDSVLQLTRAFDTIAVLHSTGAPGTLRRSAAEAGIPAVTLEAGGPMELNADYVAQGSKAINTLLDKMNMLDTLSFWGTPQPTYYSSRWVRTNAGGILFSEIKLGARVAIGDPLGTVTDPITNLREQIVSPTEGRIIGMAINQVVLPGFAAYHIGIEPSASSAAPGDLPIEEEGVLDNDEEEEEGGAIEYQLD